MFSLNCNGKLLPIERPLVMGIINITPDSFYAGSRAANDASLLQRAEGMISQGADILDIGGQSTRPGAAQLTAGEEKARVIDAIAALHRQFPDTPLSVDTWYAEVAGEAVAAGASIVNDVSGGDLDPAMLTTVGKLKVPYVCMHMKGSPATMRDLAIYEDVTREVLDFFIGRVRECREAGILDVIIDPGMGFAKRPEHDLILLKNLATLKICGCPILLGLSRKSVIHRTLGIKAAEALNGTSVLNSWGLANGADILRVHDPREAREAIILWEAYRQAGMQG